MPDFLSTLPNSELDLLAASGHLKAQFERLKRLEKEGINIDKSEQLVVLRKLAAEKNIEALIRLAEIYINEAYTLEEIDNALYILEVANSTANAYATYLIGKCYELALAIDGHEESRETEFKDHAISRYLQAYNLGYKSVFPALINLRVKTVTEQLESGSKLSISEEEIKLYWDKSNPILPELCFLRGAMYELGLGCEISIDNAVKEYANAAKESHFESVYRYANLTIFNQDHTLKKSPLSDSVAYLVLKASNAGHSGCNFVLSTLYENGYEFNKDQMQSDQLLKAAADKGFMPALEKLSGLLINQKINPSNANYRYIQNAASHNLQVAKDYINRIQLHSNKQEFWNNLRLAERGDAVGILSLAEQFEYGRGTDRDLKEAAKWYERAAEIGDINSQVKMAKWYQSGIGVKPNHERANFWRLRSES